MGDLESNQYDANAKNIFGRKIIMAHVIKNVVPEFKDIELSDIPRYFVETDASCEDKIYAKDYFGSAPSLLLGGSSSEGISRKCSAFCLPPK